MARCSIKVHACSFPMYVVKVSDFLRMEGPPEPHHALMAKGLLHEWQRGMFVVFVSHQWLGASSPDPAGHQLSVLRHALARFLDGSMQVEYDLTRSFGDFGPAKSYQELSEAYLFLDWFAIPQVTARAAGVNEATTRSDAALAVQSIPAYVEACDMFVALVPELLHTETKQPCNYNSWLARGWCRCELWCRLLSQKADTSVVVIASPLEALYILPLDWQKNLISDGLFTVEADREVVVKLGEVALGSKIEQLRTEGPPCDYRFHLAQQPMMLNEPKKDFDLDSFCQHFSFENSVDAVRTQAGMSGMLCAIISGEAGLIRELAAQRADVSARVEGLNHLGYWDGETLLMVAAKSRQQATVLRALMDRRADANATCVSVTGSIITAAWLATRPEHVRALLDYRADLETSPPLLCTAGTSTTETVQAFLDVGCEPMALAPNGLGALHTVPLFGRANCDAVANMELLLEQRADVNQRCEVKGLLQWECWKARLHVAFWGLERCGSYQRQLASLPGSTPLIVAAVQGHKGLVKSLLERDAELHVVNDRGDTAETLARAARHHEMMPLLALFSV